MGLGSCTQLSGMDSGGGTEFMGRVEKREQRPGDKHLMTHGEDAGWYSEGSGEQWKYLKLKRI